jgi:hypothetical protein
MDFIGEENTQHGDAAMSKGSLGDRSRVFLGED